MQTEAERIVSLEDRVKFLEALVEALRKNHMPLAEMARKIETRRAMQPRS